MPELIVFLKLILTFALAVGGVAFIFACFVGFIYAIAWCIVRVAIGTVRR